MEQIDWDGTTFDEVIKLLQGEISVHYPVVRRRIELFSIPDQLSSEGPWEYWRRVVAKCKEGSIGSRTTGLDLTYEQFLITLYLKGLREGDRERIHQRFMNYEASFEEMEEVAKSLEQNTVSLKAKNSKSKGMVNATANSASPTCQKCKSRRHATSDCNSSQCSYCKQWFHKAEKCYLNPQSPGFKGEAFAKQHWAKAGKKPPAPAPTVAAAAPATAAAAIGGTIAVATIKNGTLVQNAPTPRIRALQTDTNQTISILPDSGATLNIACKASCLKWGLHIEQLDPGEASLTDVQGSSIPLLGKASINLSLPSRGLDTSLSLVVSDTLGLKDLIVGWQDLQKWGVLQLPEGEVPGEGSQRVFAISPASQRFLDSQQVFPPKRTYQEIDPADPNYIQKMETACAILRQQLLEDVPLAFSDQLQPSNVVDAPPVRINIRDDMKPVSARPFPLGREDKCKSVIADLIKADTIQEFHGQSEWCSPAFFVRKGAEDVRMVVNHRRLNVATNRFGYPFESTESVFQKMEHSARVLITLDLLSAYFQM